MAEIPSDIASSAAQAGHQARNVARGRDAPRAGQAIAAKDQAQASAESDATVDTTDNDNQVYSDAEGAGSEGRTFDEGGAKTDGDAESTDKGITMDDDGRQHVDLEA